MSSKQNFDLPGFLILLEKDITSSRQQIKHQAEKTDVSRDAGITFLAQRKPHSFFFLDRVGNIYLKGRVANFPVGGGTCKMADPTTFCWSSISSITSGLLLSGFARPIRWTTPPLMLSPYMRPAHYIRLLL